MFWTGLWGIVGLVLATPMTVCLAVLGKHVPQLRFLATLFGARPALRPPARYYQRLLARDRDEAAAVVKDYQGRHSPARLYDDVLIPALVLVRRGRQRGELRPDDERFILGTTRELLGGPDPSTASPEGGGTPARAAVLGLPACDEADEVALLMLRDLSRANGQDIRLIVGDLSSGVVSLVQQERPAVVFIAALAPGGLAQARYLCQRLRSQFPELRIVVGRWGRRRDPGRDREALLAAGADRVVTTLREARAQLAQLTPGPLARYPTTVSSGTRASHGG